MLSSTHKMLTIWMCEAYSGLQEAKVRVPDQQQLQSGIAGLHLRACCSFGELSCTFLAITCVTEGRCMSF